MDISRALSWARTPAGIVAVVAAGAVGGLGAATYTLAQPVTPASVVVRQVADTSTPTETATVVVPTTEAPAPVESTQAPASAATSVPEVIVPKVVEPAPVVAPAPAPAATRIAPPKLGNPGTYGADATGEHWVPAPPTN